MKNEISETDKKWLEQWKVSVPEDCPACIQSRTMQQFYREHQARHTATIAGQAITIKRLSDALSTRTSLLVIAVALATLALAQDMGVFGK